MNKYGINKQNLEQKINIAKHKTEPQRNLLLNILREFFIGGLICLIGEVIFMIFNSFFNEELSNNYMLIILILTSALLTCFGIYDRIGQFAGCGSIIPITGFANSMASSAIEAHSEGMILGVINNVFKLAGSVIVTAVIVGVFTGLIRYFGGVLFG